MKTIDLQLLQFFEALMVERHVTKAAERMNVSQPAMSHTLARLRTIFHDPILVRTPHGLVPTDRALKLVESIREGLTHIESALQGRLGFDPTVAEICFTIFASDYVRPLFLPNLMAAVRTTAPGISLRLGMPDSTRVREDLDERNCDIIIEYWPASGEGLQSSVMFRESNLFLQESLFSIVRVDHPLVKGELSIEQFVQLPHVTYTPRGPNSSSLERIIDASLREKGLKRRIGLSHHEIHAAPAVVARTDMVATIPENIGSAHPDSARLQFLRPPIALPELVISMMWSENTHQELEYQWLRQLVRDVAKQMT